MTFPSMMLLIALNHMNELDEMEGEIEAFDLGSKSLSAEIHELEHDEHLNLELNALKSRMEITQYSPQVQRA
jgi:hypothetical protein